MADGEADPPLSWKSGKVKAGKPVGIYECIERYPIAAFGSCCDMK